MGPRRRRILRWVSRAALLGLALVAGLALWLWSLGGELEEHVARRRGQLAAVERGPVEAVREGVVTQTLWITSTSGLTFSLRVLRPEPPPPPGPLVLILGGHRTGRDAVELVGDPRGLVVAALDYPYDGPERPRGLGQSLDALGKVRPALFDTPAAVALAIDALLHEPGVDPDRVELLGASLGVPFAATSAALDSRIGRVWLVHGGADNRAWLEHALARKVAWPWLRGPLAGLMHHVGRGAALDAGRRVQELGGRALVVVASTDDERVPAQSMEALRLAAPQGSEWIWTEGPHIDPKRPELVRELVALVLGRM